MLTLVQVLEDVLELMLVELYVADIVLHRYRNVANLQPRRLTAPRVDDAHVDGACLRVYARSL